MGDEYVYVINVTIADLNIFLKNLLPMNEIYENYSDISLDMRSGLNHITLRLRCV